MTLMALRYPRLWLAIPNGQAVPVQPPNALNIPGAEHERCLDSDSIRKETCSRLRRHRPLSGDELHGRSGLEEPNVRLERHLPRRTGIRARP